MIASPVQFGLTLAERDCVVCNDSQSLTCPKCDLPKVCQYVLPTNTCLECQYAVCADPDPSSTTSTTATASATAAPSSGTTNVGGIAGGAVAGVVAIALISFLVWKFCVKNRREPLEQKPWDEDSEQHADAIEGGYAQRDPSVRTRHSIASTVLTRASNIIQIAYIPGVTNRATPTSPGLLVPPVPPIPIAVSQASSPAATEDQHFFVPGDLRDSTYSNLSGYTDRTSYARTSYAPRSSVASTIYGKNPVIIAPAQTGMRVKPGMVNVRTATGAGSTGMTTPPVPAVDYEKYNSMIRPPSPTGSTFSVGSTFLNNASAHTATTAKAMVVRVGNGPKKSPLSTPRTDEEPSTPARSIEVPTGTLIDDSDQGPFSDPVSPSHRSNSSLSAVIEEATRRASQRDSSLPVKGRERSPFGDEHATQD